MTRQKTDWGEIQWMNDEEDLTSVEGLKVGMVTLDVGKHQARHIHFDEQVIYVVQGEAVSFIGKERLEMKPGNYFHWPAGILHEVFHVGAEPFRHFMVSNVEFAEGGFFKEDEEIEPTKQQVPPDLIYRAVEAVRTQFLENIHYSYVIFDTMGNVVIQSPRYPSYCVHCCQPQENEGSCPCMVALKADEKQKEQSFRCPFGMEVFHYPIRFHGLVIGYIQGGYIRRTHGEEDTARAVYDVPESVVAGIRGLMLRIVKALQDYCGFEKFRRDLAERELAISSSEEARQILSKNLRDAQYAMTDLKINNHFLFNTLNSMASMAVEFGAMPLYQSIVDLSKMFRYTLKTQSPMVLFSKEKEYVDAYLKLQKLRYGDSLQVLWEISPQMLESMTPFNFLQPIVENAFVHGFQEVEERKLVIKGRIRQGKFCLEISNSGRSMTEQLCRTINRSLKAGVFHGLSMIYLKLQAIYGEAFSMYARPEAGGTCFVLEFPADRRTD